MTDPKLCIYNDDALSLKIDEYFESPLVVSHDVEERCKSLRVEQMQEKATVEIVPATIRSRGSRDTRSSLRQWTKGPKMKRKMMSAKIRLLFCI